MRNRQFSKYIFGATLAFVLSSGVQAVPVSVGGVKWDTDSIFDWNSTSAEVWQTVNQTTGAVSGFGRITMMNNEAQSVFCPGCELTFQYSGYTPTTSALPTPGTTLSYTGGLVQFFVDTSPETGTLNWANAGDGSLWLQGVGHGNTTIAYNGTNPNFTNILFSGLLDLNAGLALDYLNTNTQASNTDLNFGTSLNTQLNGNRSRSDNWYGSGTFSGDSVSSTVPEPSSMALFGLSLVGLGFMRRRNAK